MNICIVHLEKEVRMTPVPRKFVGEWQEWMATPWQRVKTPKEEK